MVKKIFFILAFILPQVMYGQQPIEWSHFTQKIDIQQYSGKKFKLEASVKVSSAQNVNTNARLWARIDKMGGGVGFFDNMQDNPIVDTNWKTYTITGTVDANADKLLFGGLVLNKGVFYFDNFHLSIETAGGKFEELNIFNPDFEEDSLSLWGIKQGDNGFNFGLTSETKYTGKKSLMISSSLYHANTYGDNDSVGKYANINGVKLYYETYGQGEPLLLLHGNSQSINCFQLQIPDFAKKFKVIAVDTRGQGKSTEDGKRYTYDLFAEDMNAFLDYLKLDSVNVVGWSDGGNTGLIMAMRYPKKIKKLVTMGANIFIDKTVIDKSIFNEINDRINELGKSNNDQSENAKRLLCMLLTEPDHKAKELNSIKCPVLVMAGEKDLIKENHTKLIAKNIAGSTLLIAKNETHEFPFNNPASFNKIVIDFLMAL